MVPSAAYPRLRCIPYLTQCLKLRFRIFLFLILIEIYILIIYIYIIYICAKSKNAPSVCLFSHHTCMLPIICTSYFIAQQKPGFFLILLSKIKICFTRPPFLRLKQAKCVCCIYISRISFFLINPQSTVF